MTARNIFDFVQCVPWTRDGEARTVGGVLAPVMYEITGSDASRDKPFIGEVLGTGPGVTDHLGNPEAMCVGVGDVFICNLHNLSYKLTEGGRKTYVVRNGVVYARIVVTDPSAELPKLERWRSARETDDAMVTSILGGNTEPPKETLSVQPLQDSILVRTGEAKSCRSTLLEPMTVEKRALRHMRGEGQVWFPTEAMSTDDVRSSAILAEYGEVVAVGPGRFRDGRWVEPPCKAGDLVIYDGSYSTLPIRIRGESFTLVPTPQLVKVADEG